MHQGMSSLLGPRSVRYCCRNDFTTLPKRLFGAVSAPFFCPPKACNTSFKVNANLLALKVFSNTEMILKQLQGVTMWVCWLMGGAIVHETAILSLVENASPARCSHGGVWVKGE